MNKFIYVLFVITTFSYSLTVFARAAVASDKPVWSINCKKLNMPGYGTYSKWISIKIWDWAKNPEDAKPNPRYKIRFTPDNKILVSFIQIRRQIESAIKKDVPEKFTALLLSRETGELIKRVEWPLAPEVMVNEQQIHPLPSGGYVGIINGSLQSFDSSFNVIRGRVLEKLKPGEGSYQIVVPLSGKYFILWRTVMPITEIIDSGTLNIMERFDGLPNNTSTAIWEDRLLLIRPGNNGASIYEKKIGELRWNYLESTQVVNTRAGFIYTGAIFVSDLIRQGADTKRGWFMIEGVKKSDPVLFHNNDIGVLSSKFSWHTPVMAIVNNKQLAIVKALDFNNKHFIEAYDLSARQALFKTKKYEYHDTIDYAISADGNSIVVISKKKIELYSVNSKKNKK